MQVYLTEVQIETFFTSFFIQFCILTSASYSTSGYLFLKTYLIVFGGLGYIVFIHKKFCRAQLQIFSHLRKNILVTVKNWWSLTYGQVYGRTLVALKSKWNRQRNILYRSKAKKL